MVPAVAFPKLNYNFLRTVSGINTTLPIYFYTHMYFIYKNKCIDWVFQLKHPLLHTIHMHTHTFSTYIYEHAFLYNIGTTYSKLFFSCTFYNART